MRVLVVSAYFRPHIGGVERFAELLASGLGDRGHDVTVLCCRTDRSSPLEEQLGTVRVRRLPATNVLERRLGVPYPVPAPRALFRDLAHELARADVVQVNDVLYATSVASLARARLPVMLTHHVGFVPQGNAALDLAQSAALRAVGPLVRRASRWTTYNPAIASWAETRWSLPGVEVLPVGVAVAAATADRRSFGLPTDRPVFLFAGRDVAKKNLDLVLAAADPAYELVAVTDRTAANTPGVTMLPLLEPGLFSSLLAGVDGLVLPSRGEGIPLTLQEAMVSGVPVVTTMQPGYERYFGAKDVLVVEPETASIRAALRRLAADAGLAHSLRERSRAIGSKSFSLEGFVAPYERALAELASEGIRRGDRRRLRERMPRRA